MPSQRIRGVLVWTVENAMKTVYFCILPYTFESALVWTGPENRTIDTNPVNRSWPTFSK